MDMDAVPNEAVRAVSEEEELPVSIECACQLCNSIKVF